MSRSREQEAHSTVQGVVWIVLLAALCYVGWKYVPPWYDNLVLKGAVKDYLKRAPRKSHPSTIQQAVYEAIEAEGVDLEQVEVEISGDRQTSGLWNRLTINTTFTPIVIHPFVNKEQQLEFGYERTRAYAVDW